MDDNKNNLIVLGGAGLLLLILVIFAVTGAKSNPPQAGVVNFELDNIPSVTAEDNTRGFADARVKLIEYSDIECPFCQEYHGQLVEVTEEEPLANFSWTYRHFPLTQIHADAFGFAVATECAADQGKFDNYIDSLTNGLRADQEFDKDGLVELATTLELDSNRFAACLDEDEVGERVREESNQATSSGATGTPFSVFQFDREVTEAEFEEMKGLLGNDSAVLSDDRTKVGVGGVLSANSIRNVTNLIVDPVSDEVEQVISEGTDE